MTVVLALTLAALLAGLRLPLLAALRQPWLAWLVGASLGAFALYGCDKLAAQQARPRVPEQVLLGLAMLGGSPGALLGMLLFRHKTRKRPFLRRFLLVLLVQVGAILAWQLRAARPQP